MIDVELAPWEIRDILIRAKAHQARVGLNKHSYFTSDSGACPIVEMTPVEAVKDTPCCMMGAVVYAVSTETLALGMPGPVYSYLLGTVTTSGPYVGVGEFNDEPSTTLQDVLDMFDMAIEGL